MNLRRLFPLIAVSALAALIGIVDPAEAQDTVDPFDVTTGYDHVGPPPPGAASTADWCMSFGDPGLAGRQVEIIAEGPSGEVSGEGTIADDGTLKVEVGINEGGTYRVTSVRFVDTGDEIDPGSLDANDVTFEPLQLDCRDTLRLPPPPPATSGAPTTTGTPATVAPPPTVSSQPPLVNPGPGGGGSSIPWWILAGGGVLLMFVGLGVWFGPSLGSVTRKRRYDFKVQWTTRTDETLKPLASTTLKEVRRGHLHAATYQVTVATRLVRVEPDAVVSAGGTQKFVPEDRGDADPIFHMQWSKAASGGGDGTRTEAASTIAMTSGKDPAKDQDAKVPSVTPLDTAFELAEEIIVRVELVELNERFHSLYSKSHEFFGKGQSSIDLSGNTVATTRLHNLSPPVFEISAGAAAAMSSSLSALNYSAKENSKLRRAVKGKTSELKLNRERSELALGVGPLTLLKFSLGFEGGEESANKDLSARFEGGPAIHRASRTELAATVAMLSEIETAVKMTPKQSIDRWDKTWSATARGRVNHQLVLHAEVDPAKYTALATDEEQTCLPSLRLSLGAEEKLPDGSDLAEDFDKERWGTRAPFDGRLWIPATGSSRLIFDLGAPAFHAKPGITSSGKSKDGGLTMDSTQPKRPEPEPDDTIRCWTAENHGLRRRRWGRRSD